jgi:hypothetical protein
MWISCVNTFQNPLPQSGWVLSQHLAEAIGVSSETIADWLHKYGIPHRKPGSKIIIHMETFFSSLPEGLGDIDPKKKAG